MNEIKITTQKDVNINQRGRCGKYRWLYSKIDKELKKGETMVFENLDSIREAQKIVYAIRRQYKSMIGDGSMTVSLRKYSESGLDKPTIYLNWR